MLQVALISLAALAISLAVAGAFIRRSKVFLGVVLGLLPMALMELGFHGSLNASIRGCLASACASAGLPADCVIAEFGCTEWSGLGYFLFFVAGIGDLALYTLGVAALAILRFRHRPPPSSRGGDPPR